VETGIDADLQRAFLNAIYALDDWSPGRDEPSLRYERRRYTIGDIADLAACYNDRVTANVWVYLRQPWRGGEPGDNTFAAAGRSLRRLYDEMKAWHANSDQRMLASR
jgi:hypothetical protein